MKIGHRKLTNTKTNRIMSFDREYLDEIGFTAGNYTVLYENNRVSIVKNVENVILKE